jgi:hypothetical protein
LARGLRADWDSLTSTVQGSVRLLLIFWKAGPRATFLLAT